ncbi:hypothetical protein IscW_ISCW008848 [Ixodes scapularis]|uniref:Uncharacterized protein n=1 Tax=Ixodes scapularis TaxID=6945 RepID=B7PYS2_IXOSC|nr:hypothetical protein IscW_ISCW008848 [Ixodes scapularis]|eukprot:XP_002403808.1 hypothetical protein IscW_ISCW008848 [Ixodes scapularis]
METSTKDSVFQTKTTRSGPSIKRRYVGRKTGKRNGGALLPSGRRMPPTPARVQRHSTGACEDSPSTKACGSQTARSSKV